MIIPVLFLNGKKLSTLELRDSSEGSQLLKEKKNQYRNLPHVVSFRMMVPIPPLVEVNRVENCFTAWSTPWSPRIIHLKGHPTQLVICQSPAQPTINA